MSEFLNDGQESDDLTNLFTRQEESGTNDFLPDLRHRIQRRSLAAQVATFTWELSQEVLLELLNLTQEVFVAVSPRKENEP